MDSILRVVFDQLGHLRTRDLIESLLAAERKKYEEGKEPGNFGVEFRHLSDKELRVRIVEDMEKLGIEVLVSKLSQDTARDLLFILCSRRPSRVTPEHLDELERKIKQSGLREWLEEMMEHVEVMRKVGIDVYLDDVDSSVIDPSVHGPEWVQTHFEAELFLCGVESFIGLQSISWALSLCENLLHCSIILLEDLSPLTAASQLTRTTFTKRLTRSMKEVVDTNHETTVAAVDPIAFTIPLAPTPDTHPLAKVSLVRMAVRLLAQLPNCPQPTAASIGAYEGLAWGESAPNSLRSSDPSFPADSLGPAVVSEEGSEVSVAFGGSIIGGGGMLESSASPPQPSLSRDMVLSDLLRFPAPILLAYCNTQSIPLPPLHRKRSTKELAVIILAYWAAHPLPAIKVSPAPRKLAMRSPVTVRKRRSISIGARRGPIVSPLYLRNRKIIRKL